MKRRTLSVIALVIATGCTDNRSVEIAGPLQLQAAESHTVKSQQPLRATEPFAEACLLPATASQLTQVPPYALVAEDQNPFLPSISMLGTNGKADSFQNTSLLRTQDNQVWLCFSSSGQRPNAPYVAIIIQAPTQFRLAAIRWQNYDK